MKCPLCGNELELGRKRSGKHIDICSYCGFTRPSQYHIGDSKLKLCRGDFVMYCSSPEGCPGELGDIWCIIDGNVCQFLTLGFKRSVDRMD